MAGADAALSRQELDRGRGLQEAEAGELEEAKLAVPEYGDIDAGGNKLGDNGLKWIAKANWPSL
jgi:hypothetical protein